MFVKEIVLGNHGIRFDFVIFCCSRLHILIRLTGKKVT